VAAAFTAAQLGLPRQDWRGSDDEETWDGLDVRTELVEYRRLLEKDGVVGKT